MKELQPFFKAFWQVTIPVYIVLQMLEVIKPGLVQSRLSLGALFVIMVTVWLIDVVLIHNKKSV